MKRKDYHSSADRYFFDFGQCSSSVGFAQVDTRQDCWYYGQWFNPKSLTFISFIEGDVTEIQFESKEECAEYMRYVEKLHLEHDGKPAKIDGMCCESIINAVKELGLGDMLH